MKYTQSLTKINIFVYFSLFPYPDNRQWSFVLSLNETMHLHVPYFRDQSCAAYHIPYYAIQDEEIICGHPVYQSTDLEIFLLTIYWLNVESTCNLLKLKWILSFGAGGYRYRSIIPLNWNQQFLFNCSKGKPSLLG